MLAAVLVLILGGTPIFEMSDADLDAFEGELKESKTSAKVAEGRPKYRVRKTRRRR